MTLERRDIAAALMTKGFRQEDRDHDYYFLYLGDTKQAVYTKLSRGHGYRTIRDNLVTLIARQMKLTKGELEEFVDCSMSGADYVRVLRQRDIELREPSAPPPKKKK